MCDICEYNYSTVLFRCSYCCIRICSDCDSEVVIKEYPHDISYKVLCLSCEIRSSLIINLKY